MDQVGLMDMCKFSFGEWEHKDRVKDICRSKGGLMGDSLSRLTPRLRTAELGRCREWSEEASKKRTADGQYPEAVKREQGLLLEAGPSQQCWTSKP